MLKFNLTTTRTENGITTVEQSVITEKQYNNITNKDTLKYFRSLGGSETAQRCYTCAGYIIFKLISRSPDRNVKVVREFEPFYEVESLS